MSKIETLGGGYGGGSQRVKNNNQDQKNSNPLSLQPISNLKEVINLQKLNDKIETLGGGYKGGSPRVRSNNLKNLNQSPPQQKILIKDLIDQISIWKIDGLLTEDEIQKMIEDLKKI